jgi:putative ABC transport system permease protein
MAVWEYVGIALENLRLNKLRSFLTIIGIVVGVAAVVTVVSIGEAGRQSVVSEISQYGKGFFVIYPNYAESSAQYDPAITTRDIEEIRKLPGVERASAYLNFAASTTVGKEKADFSVSAGNAVLHQMEKIDIIAGRFFNEGENRSRQNVLIVDDAFAEAFMGGAERAVNQKIVLHNRIYRIIGVYKKPQSLLAGLGGVRYNAYMPIGSIPFQMSGDRVDFLQATSSLEGEELRRLVDEVKALLAKRHRVDPDAYLSQTAAEAEQQISTVFNILQTIIGSIAGISLLVGGIGVMNIMLVSVTERTREIGIRKAIGATPGAIMAQFVIEAVILCFAGGIIGALLGLSASGIFSAATGWPFTVSGRAILLAFFFSAAVGIFFGLYPANKASRMQPIESLRYE